MPGFARCFAVCLVAVAGKLADRHPHVLASVAEEMALSVILDEAEAILDMQGRRVDMRAEAEGAFQDADFERFLIPASMALRTVKRPSTRRWPTSASKTGSDSSAQRSPCTHTSQRRRRRSNRRSATAHCATDARSTDARPQPK